MFLNETCYDVNIDVHNTVHSFLFSGFQILQVGRVPLIFSVGAIWLQNPRMEEEAIQKILLQKKTFSTNPVPSLQLNL
jgi:hypothetical protein